MIRKAEWHGYNGQYLNVTIKSHFTSLTEKEVNKALMIAMNYLLENKENIETEVEESAE